MNHTQPIPQPFPVIHSTNHHSSWVEIDASAFEHNLQQYKKVTQPVLFAPVIKSNAYGHGIELIAQLCQASTAVDRICVVSLSEAIRLRTQGILKPIIVLSILDADLTDIPALDVAVVLYDIHTATQLNSIGKEHNTKIKVHIKIDTGLSRLGVLTQEAVAFVHAVRHLTWIHIEGIFSHCAESEKEDQTFTNQQIAQFTQVLDTLDAQGIHIPLRHISCSAAITGTTRSHFTVCRAGIGIYGLWPSTDNKKMTLQSYPNFTLKPVLSWKTRIIQIKIIESGSYVGYDRTHQVQRNTVVAVVPVGYWDGYDRRLSNKGQVLIHHTVVPIIGRIAMNLMMIDITDIPTAYVGDTVTLLGTHNAISVEQLAAQAQTINYEIVTRINPLVPRVIASTL